MWHLYVDGAARGNPGESGIGIYIEKAGNPHYEAAYYLGERTNNQAEYCALLVGLYQLQRMRAPQEHVTIHTDSQLLAKQISGAYRVKKPWLQTLYRRVCDMLEEVQTYTIEHIPRSHNAKADALANYAIDHYIPLPNHVGTLCHA